MDIFKLLSRSTKQDRRGTSDGRDQHQQLPSSGKLTNPQLYHDLVPESRGTKRKRTTGKEEPMLHIPEEEEEVNYFVSKIAAPKSAIHNSKAIELQPEVQDASDVPERLSEEKCRQILRSHRLKLTLLQSSGRNDKKLKKSKQSKAPKKSSSRDAHRQIYPQPLMAFRDLKSLYGIEGRMSENLAGQGYKIPTEVQMGSLPLLLQPDVALSDFEKDHAIDLLAIAPTGSGKTLAFLISVVNKIIQRRRGLQERTHTLEAIVVVPTKELASQIVNEAKKLCIGTGVKVVGMRKGLEVVNTGKPVDDYSSEEEEGEDIHKAQSLAKMDILVTTPGLLLSAITMDSGELRELTSVKTLVLDEADVLLDPLFREQTLGIWKSCVNPMLRVTLWSATMGSSIETLAASTIQERKERFAIKVQATLIRLVVGLKDSAIPNITHRLIYAATEAGKLIALRQLLHPTAQSVDGTQALRPPFLVFTQTIPRAVALHSELLYDIPAEAGGAARIAVLHSDLSDSVRDNTMTRFRNGEIWILITTDILSRGVDFKGVNGVVNYDVPNSGASYIHRVGRTGRAGRDGGTAVTYYTKEDIPHVKNIANIIAASEKQAGKAPGEASMQKWLLDALPTPSKDEKKKLKMHGVEARRRDTKGKSRMQISTKSGYERKMENKRRGAITGSKRRAAAEAQAAAEDSEWGGIDD